MKQASILEQKVSTTPEAMKQTFSKMPQSLIALETGTHSPWVSRLLTELGYKVIVAHAQKVQLITKSNRKDDRHDARTLARLARIDPQLLGPVRHRSGERSSRVGEVLWRTTTQVWHTAGERKTGRGIERGVARCPGAAFARGPIAERAHPRVRPTDGENRQGSV